MKVDNYPIIPTL